MLITLNTMVSTSASKKAQNFSLAFNHDLSGSSMVLKKIEKFSKEKMVLTPGLDALLEFLKTADKETVEKYAKTSAARMNKAAIWQLISSKNSFDTTLKYLKRISAPKPAKK